ncbi:MAG: hypothetical protein KKG11_14255, partial [Gammaproteobacteria bacterium]|nr:hypothetical protein [Gammaproteobacteria bacterium]
MNIAPVTYPEVGILKSPSILENIRRQAVRQLLAHKPGLRYAELSKLLVETMPAVNGSKVATALHNLEVIKSKEVFKTSNGQYRHQRFKSDEVSRADLESKGNGGVRVVESAFYGTFADWLKNDAEAVTHAIPLGGNVFRDRWGTPDVIGKRESRRSDVIKVPTLIVAAEIKVDMMDLVTGFGQACAYRLFCHSSYLVIPKQTSELETARLEALCEISGIALVTFDRNSPHSPSFSSWSDRGLTSQTWVIRIGIWQ